MSEKDNKQRGLKIRYLLSLSLSLSLSLALSLLPSLSLCLSLSLSLLSILHLKWVVGHEYRRRREERGRGGRKFIEDKQRKHKRAWKPSKVKKKNQAEKNRMKGQICMEGRSPILGRTNFTSSELFSHFLTAQTLALSWIKKKAFFGRKRGKKIHFSFFLQMTDSTLKG